VPILIKCSQSLFNNIRSLFRVRLNHSGIFADSLKNSFALHALSDSPTEAYVVANPLVLSANCRWSLPTTIVRPTKGTRPR